jgi:hypothetical protein
VFINDQLPFPYQATLTGAWATAPGVPAELAAQAGDYNFWAAQYVTASDNLARAAVVLQDSLDDGDDPDDPAYAQTVHDRAKGQLDQCANGVLGMLSDIIATCTANPGFAHSQAIAGECQAVIALFA